MDAHVLPYKSAYRKFLALSAECFARLRAVCYQVASLQSPVLPYLGLIYIPLFSSTTPDLKEKLLFVCKHHTCVHID